MDEAWEQTGFLLLVAAKELSPPELDREFFLST